MIGSTSRQKHKRRDAGKQKEGEGRENGGRLKKAKKRQTIPAVCFLHSYVPQAHRRHGGSLWTLSVQAVDIINNSVVFLQRRPLSWLGVLIVSVALRYLRKGCENKTVPISKMGKLEKRQLCQEMMTPSCVCT